ncbi:MAG: hypothetical protein V3575_05915 [Candidatus Absconditabacteria bacterium]
MLVDMHFHSTQSDGGLNSNELVEKIKSKGGKIAVCTDHDIVNKEIVNLLANENITSCEGVEISVGTFIDGTERHLHMTAYSKSFSPELIQILNGIVENRKVKIIGQIGQLEKSGFEINKDSFFEYLAQRGTNLNNINNFHIAQYIFENPSNLNLVKKLLGENVDMGLFIRQCLKKKGDFKHIGCYEIEKYEPEIIDIIKNLDNGVLSIAHPNFSFELPKIQDPIERQKQEFAAFEKFVKQAVQQGVKAIEIGTLCDKNWTEKIIRLANKHNLIITFGSDFHYNIFDERHVDMFEKNPHASDYLIEKNIDRLFSQL